MFMETTEHHVLRPLRNMKRRMHTTNVVSLVKDSHFEFDFEKASSIFIDPPLIAGYEPLLHSYLALYPIFKIEGANLLIPTME